MNLLELCDTSQLPEAGQRMLGSAGPKNLLGTLAHSPGGLEAQAALSAHVGRHSRLDAALREMAILQVAAALGSRYIFVHHVDRAFDAGVSDEAIRALAAGTLITSVDGPMSAVLDMARAAAAGTPVSDETVATLRGHLPDEEVADLVIVTTFYVMVARQCAILRTEIEPAYHHLASRYPLIDSSERIQP